jgi:hypothetical protein
MNFITLTPTQTAYLAFEGYFFERLEFIYLSATNNTIFPYICAVNYFTDSTKLSSAFLPISGFPYNNYSIRGENGLSVTLHGLSAGIYDLILGNAAGYTLLSTRNYLISTN